MAHKSCESQIAVLEMNGQSVPQRWTSMREGLNTARRQCSAWDVELSAIRRAKVLASRTRQDRSETQKSVLVLVLQVWCCVVKHDLVTLVVIMILKDAATFQVLFIVSLFCAWNITRLPYCGDQQWRSSTKKLNPWFLCLAYFRWSWSCSWSWSCKQRSWS